MADSGRPTTIAENAAIAAQTGPGNAGAFFNQATRSWQNNTQRSNSARVAAPTGGGVNNNSNELAVISSVQGKNVLDEHIANQNKDINDTLAIPAYGSLFKGPGGGINKFDPNTGKPLSDTPVTTPTKPSTTQTDAMKTAGGVTAEEAKAAGIDLSSGYTYDQNSGYFMPSQNNSSNNSDQLTPDQVRSNYQGEIDKANETFRTMIGGMDAGTQALVTSLNNIYQDRINAQSAVNRNELSSFNTMNIRGGTSRYAGGVAQSILTADENAGLDRIKAISNELADKISTANNNLQDKKYAAFVDNRNEIDKLRTEANAQIKDLHDQAVAKAKDDRDFAYQQKKDADNLALETKKYDLTVSNSKVDNALKRAQIAEIMAKATPADLSSAASWVKDIKNGTAKISDVPEALKSAVAVGLANGAESTNSLLTTSKASLDELNAMVNEGPGLLGTIYNDVKGVIPGGDLLPSAGTGFTSAVGAKGLSSFFGLKEKPLAGTQAAAFDAKLNQVKNDVIIPNLNLLHGLGRITDREFQALSSAVTSLSTDLPEDQFKTELKNVTDRVNQKITDNQDSLIGDNIRTAIQGKFTPAQIIQTYMQDPTMASRIQVAKTQGWSDQDIVNYYLNK